jgi:hypothetical protein
MGAVGSPMMAALSDSEGRRISERAVPLDLPPVDPHAARLIGAGDRFALFWLNAAGPARVALIDLDARVTEIHTLELPRYDSASFAWNGTHFLAVIRRGFNTPGEAFLLELDGRAVHGPIPVPESTVGTDVIAVDGRFVLVSTNTGAAYVRTIGKDGATEWTHIPALRGTGTYAVAAPAPAGGVLVVWSAWNGNGSDLMSAIRRADGTATAPQTIATDAGSIWPREVLAAAGGYVVAFTTETSGVPARWVVRLDAAGAKAAEPLELGERAVSRTITGGAANGKVMLLAETPPVRTIAIGADAQPRTPELMSIRPSRQTQPILSAGGGRVLAAWTEIAMPAAAVRGATLDASGEPLGVTHIAPAFTTARELAWNGVHHLVVHRDLTRLMATRVTADGVPIDEQPIVLAPFAMYGWNTAATVAWTGDQWMVVWSDHNQLWMVKVSRGGIASLPRPLQVHPALPGPDWARFVDPPSIASDGKRVLLIWRESHTEPCGMPGCGNWDNKTFAARLTPDGEPFGNTLELELAAGSGSVSIATSGEEFMALAGTRAFVVAAGEPALRVAATREVFGLHGTTDVTWDGREYVVALRYRLVHDYLGLIRLDREAKPVAAPRATGTLRPDWSEPPSVAAPFPGAAIIGVQEGTIAEGVRAAVYLESDLSALPAPPTPPRSVRVQRLNASQHAVTWDPSPSGDAEIYVVEVQRADGQWHASARVAAHLLTAVVWTYSEAIAFRVRAVNAGGSSEPAEPITPAKRRSVR